MPKASKATAQQVETAPGYEGHFTELEGYTVAFETYSEESDLQPLFDGLPDNQCQCPHWGVVLKGSLTYRYADREETIHAGEAYYVPPGHSPILHAGAEVVEFSPTEELAQTFEVVKRNLAAGAAG
jgi:mannose-6-phosphate isomerase-like protein (cupin superfamily)